MEPGEVPQNGSPEPAFCLLDDESSFCVILREGGKTERVTNTSPGEYINAIRDASVAWVDFTVKDLEQEIEGIGISMGFQRIPYQKLLSGFYSSYEDYDTELGIMLPAVSMTENDMAVHPIIILIRGNFIVTIHQEGINRLLKFSRYAQPFLKKIVAENTPDRLTLVLERIIDENNDRNFEYLRGIEAHGDSISKSLIEENISKKQIAQDIYTMKHVLINYLNVLWATKDVIESLRYGDSDLITDDEHLLGRIGILSDNLDRHIELSEQMSHVLASGLEVMQSIYNNQLQSLNNRFALVTAYLTVLGTAFLVPNTIATIAGSGIMGGTMAAQWWYLPLLIVSTIVATATSFLWVLHVWKRKED
ncbi:MAG TPA: CorA family divalent cation transporter [Methanoregulaceae archaeon]|nr:CorA family divalent cation transporter [Methanoregulaceae archaeon]